jgi:hypothetical protein
MSVGIGLWRHPGRRLEHAVEMEPAHAGLARQVIEARKFIGRFDQPASQGHCRRVRLVRSWRCRVATLAGAKTGALGLGGGCVKGDIAAMWQA